MAEKRIIETELEQLKPQESPEQKTQTLTPPELFPSPMQESSRGILMPSCTCASWIKLYVAHAQQCSPSEQQQRLG